MRVVLLLVASVLAAGCSGSAPAETGPREDAPSAHAPFEPVTHTFQGAFLLGGVDAPQEHTFGVPDGTTEVMGLLTWSVPGGALDLQLIDGRGEVVADGWGESDQHRYVTTTLTPVPGTWTARVSAQQGADVQYELTIEAREGEPFGPIERVYTVPPRAFAEINLNMVPGNGFTFEWASDAELYFNVHFHAHGGTERPIEHRGTELAGNFTAPNTEVYSLLWRNEGVLPVEVTVAVDGTYRLHSMTRDASET